MENKLVVFFELIKHTVFVKVHMEMNQYPYSAANYCCNAYVQSIKSSERVMVSAYKGPSPLSLLTTSLAEIYCKNSPDRYNICIAFMPQPETR